MNPSRDMDEASQASCADEITDLAATSRARSVWSLRVGLGSVALLGCLAYAGLCSPGRLLVTEVTIDGADRAGLAELRHLADVPNGTAGWQVDVARIEAGLRAHPWVQAADVSLRWQPNGTAAVHATVTEYRPVALLADGALRYVAQDGQLIADATSDDLDYPVLEGMGAGLAARHPELPQAARQSALALVESLVRSGLIDESDLSTVSFHPALGFTVYVGRARVAFGLQNHAVQLDRLSTLVARGEVDLTQPVSVDLGGATTAVVRPIDVTPPRG